MYVHGARVWCVCVARVWHARVGGTHVGLIPCWVFQHKAPNRAGLRTRAGITGGVPREAEPETLVQVVYVGGEPGRTERAKGGQPTQGALLGWFPSWVSQAQASGSCVGNVFTSPAGQRLICVS